MELDVGMIVFIGIVALAALLALGRRFLLPVLRPAVRTWDGEILAVIVHYARNPRLRGDDSPLSAAPVIRERAGGGERMADNRVVDALPSVVLRQLFGSTIYDTLNPRFNLPTGELRRQAAQAAKSGGFRFDLPEPVRVAVEETADGDLRWRKAR